MAWLHCTNNRSINAMVFLKLKELTGGINSDGPWNMYSLDELQKNQKDKRHEQRGPKLWYS